MAVLIHNGEAYSAYESWDGNATGGYGVQWAGMLKDRLIWIAMTAIVLDTSWSEGRQSFRAHPTTAHRAAVVALFVAAMTASFFILLNMSRQTLKGARAGARLEHGVSEMTVFLCGIAGMIFGLPDADHPWHVVLAPFLGGATGFCFVGLVRLRATKEITAALDLQQNRLSFTLCGGSAATVG